MPCPIVVPVIVALAVIAIIYALCHRKPKPETKPASRSTSGSKVGYPTNGNQPKAGVYQTHPAPPPTTVVKEGRPPSQRNPAVVHRDRDDFYDRVKSSPPQTDSGYPLGHPMNPNTHLLYGNSATYSDEPQTSSKRFSDCDAVSKPSESYQAEASKVSCYSSGSGSSSSYSSDSSYSSSSSSDSGSSSSSCSSSSSSD